MKKRLLVLIIALAIVAAGLLGINATDVSAVSVTISNLFVQASGSSYISRSVDDQGVKITFNSTAKESSIRYLQLMHMENFEVEFDLIDVSFKEFIINLYDNYNSSKFIRITLSNDGTNLKVVLRDNYRNEAETIIPLTQLKGKIKIIYLGTVNEFRFSSDESSLNNTLLNDAGIVTKSFYNYEARMTFGVADHSDTDGSNIYVNSISNKNGKQEFSKSTETNVVPIIGHYINNELNFVSGSTISLDAALGHRFTIPYYTIDILGDGLNVRTQFEAKGTNTFDSDWFGVDEGGLDSKFPASSSITSLLMSGNVDGKKLEEGDKYYIHIANLLDRNELGYQEVTLKVTLKLDTQSPIIKDAAVVSAVREAYPNLSIDAPLKDNTLTFPSLILNDGVIDFVNGDGIDANYNVNFQLGYKRPNEATWQWSSNTDVSINAIGYWTFTYRVKDAAGNTSYLGGQIGAITFGYYINDVTPPEIDAYKEQTIYLNKAFTVSLPSITDNASGVNSAWSKYKVYFIDGDGVRTLLEDNKKSQLFEGKITATQLTNENGDKNYFEIEFSARDNVGNISEVKITKLIVKVSTDLEKLPANDILKTIAIIIACVAGVCLVLLLIVNPDRKRERSPSFVKTKEVDDKEDKKK